MKLRVLVVAESISDIISSIRSLVEQVISTLNEIFSLYIKSLLSVYMCVGMNLMQTTVKVQSWPNLARWYLGSRRWSMLGRRPRSDVTKPAIGQKRPQIGPILIFCCLTSTVSNRRPPILIVWYLDCRRMYQLSCRTKSDVIKPEMCQKRPKIGLFWHFAV